MRVEPRSYSILHLLSQGRQGLPVNLVGLALVVSATGTWSTSGTFVAIIRTASGVSPQGIAFWRDLTTFICLLSGILVFQPALLRVPRRDLPWLAALGVIGVGWFHILWNTSVVMNGVPVATVLQYNAPMFVAVAAWALWREPVTPRKGTAIVLAFVGTVLIARLDGQSAHTVSPAGFLVGLGTATNFGLYSLLGKRLLARHSRWTVLLYAFGFAALGTLPFQYGRPLIPAWPVPFEAWGAFTGLVLVTTIAGFGLYAAGLRRLPASVASIVATMEVPFAAAVSYLVLGQRLDGLQVTGALLVVGGVVLVSRSHNNDNGVSAR